MTVIMTVVMTVIVTVVLTVIMAEVLADVGVGNTAHNSTRFFPLVECTGVSVFCVKMRPCGPPGRPVPVCGSFSRSLEPQIGVARCCLQFSVGGIRGGKSVSFLWDQKPPKRFPFRGIKGPISVSPVDNGGLMSINPERGALGFRSGREK